MKNINHFMRKNLITYAKKNLVPMRMMKNIKVKDHCYFTGKYRGAAHNICNLRYKQHTKKILAAFHNSSMTFI